MRRALVTGSGGFLGRHFVRALLAGGYDVDTLELERAKQHRNMISYLPTIHRKYDLAIHAAAYVHGRRAIERQRTFLGAYNLQLDATFFEWALRERPRHVVYISSSAAYPVVYQTADTAGTRLHESLLNPQASQLWQPDATYGFTKLVGERLSSELSDEASDVSVHVVRPFSGYGADQDINYPFRAFLRRAIERADPFDVWGDGLQTRDWVHVDDVVGATLAAVDVDFCRPLNICTGVPTNFLQLADMFIEAVGDETYTPQISTVPSAPVGVHYRVGDPTRLLGVYVPKVSIEEGIRKAVVS